MLRCCWCVFANQIESHWIYCDLLRGHSIAITSFRVESTQSSYAGKHLCETDERAEWSQQRKKKNANGVPTVRKRSINILTAKVFFSSANLIRKCKDRIHRESDTYTDTAAKSPKHSEIQFATSIFQLTSSPTQGIKRLYCRLPFNRWGQIIKCERRAQFRLVFLVVPILWPKGVRAYWICIDQYSVVWVAFTTSRSVVAHKIWWHSNGSVWLENGDDGRMPEPTPTTKIG